MNEAGVSQGYFPPETTYRLSALRVFTLKCYRVLE